MKIKKIENLFFNKCSIDIIETDFDINETSFVIECANKVDLDFFYKGISEHCDYLFCYDSDGIKFTLYDCYIAINKTLQYKIESFKITYNKIIFGNHFKEINKIKINKLESVIENSKLTYKIHIGKNQWTLQDDINIKTEWNVDDNGNIKGIKLIIQSSKVDKTLQEYINIFDNVICIFFWQIGYFPDSKKINFYINDEKYEYNNPNKSIYNTNGIIRAKSRLNSDLNKFPNIYEKWENLYNNNLILMHLFFEVQNSNGFEEVKTFNYIQCLEAIYTNNIIKNIFDDKEKNEIKEIFNKIIDSNKKNKLTRKLNRIIRKIRKKGNNYTLLDFKNTLAGKLNDINKLSLYKKIKEMYSNKFAQVIFKYENDNNLLKEFIQKTYNHRNFVAHINNNGEYFKGKENRIVQLKFKLLYRLNVMEMIGMPIDKSYLEEYVNDIDKLYDVNDFPE